MSRRPQLSRQVPADSVTKFDDWCQREGHVNEGDKGRHAEKAIIEYLPPDYRPDRFRDDLDELEADLRADLDEVGQLSSSSSLNETPASTSSDETDKLTYRVSKDVQDSLERYVYDQEGKVRGVLGEYVAAALDDYRDGGQVARVRRYYEQLRGSVDMVSEDRVGAVVKQLETESADRDYYHIETIRCAVDEALDVHSEDVQNEFADRVIERLGLVIVETADGVYAPPETAEKMVQRHEMDSSVNWYSTDKQERVEYLKKAVKARSKTSGQGAGVDYNQVRDEVFEGHPSNDYCYDLMALAGEDCGFDYDKHNGKLMLRYTGKDESLEAKNEWADDAARRVQEFCDENEVDPREVDQAVLDNRIVQAKFPGEYDEVEGPSDRGFEAVTGNDRKRVRNHLIDSADHNETQRATVVEEEMSRLTTEAEPVTDGGQKHNK